MGEELTQVWLKPEMSELFAKEVNAQKQSLKKLPGLTQAPTSPQKVCSENERNKKKSVRM